MGVDYDAKFVYGWIFEDDAEGIEEIFDKIIKYEELVYNSDTSDDSDDSDDLYEKYSLISDHLSDKYKIYLKYANPYYDCGIYDAVFYISLVTDPDIRELKKLFETPLSKELVELIQHIDLKEEDLVIDCLPHIW